MIAVGVAVGLLVGLLGAGGSIVTVPALMLLLDLSATEATGTSLVVVAIVSTVSLLGHLRGRRVDWRAGLAFVVTGIPAALLGGMLSVWLADVAITLILVVLLFGTGVWMWQRRPVTRTPEPASWMRVGPAGAGVGLLTGTLGVGGGFVVVPGLVGLVSLPTSVAIGTSQLVLVVNALAGLVGRAGSGTVDLAVALSFAAGGAAGAMGASFLVGRIPERVLTRLFAVVVVVVAVVLTVDAVLDRSLGS